MRQIGELGDQDDAVSRLSAQEWSALRTLRATLEAALARVFGWLRRPDLLPEARVEGSNLVMEAISDLPAPEDDDDGPGM